MNFLKPKNVFLLLLIFGLKSACEPKNSSDSKLKLGISKVIKAINTKDPGINKMVHPEIGVFVIYRLGVFNQYLNTDKIDFDNPKPAYLRFPNLDLIADLNFDSLPTYSCDKEEWSKIGLFCDTTNRNHLLSTTASNLIKYDLVDTMTQTTVETYQALEQKSHRVVLAGMDGKELVFYLTLIENKWYLTILDLVTSDCSA